MSDENKRRIEEIAELMEKIPPEKQEGVVIGITMFAALCETTEQGLFV